MHADHTDHGRQVYRYNKARIIERNNNARIIVREISTQKSGIQLGFEPGTFRMLDGCPYC